jgi:rubrerythrin
VAIIEKALKPVQHKCPQCGGLFFGDVCHLCKMPREKT